MTGPLGQRRQRPRRRITPNANTSTTTMISTHNHVDMAASLVGAWAVQADATAAYPSKQLGHRQASSRSRIDGRACAPARGDPGTPRPARRSGLARQPTTSAPVGAEPFRATPSQPSPTTAPSTTRAEDRAGVTDPTRPQRPRPAGMARPSSVCPAWVGKQSKHGCAETR